MRNKRKNAFNTPLRVHFLLSINYIYNLKQITIYENHF